jgi:hypothetical protein
MGIVLFELPDREQSPRELGVICLVNEELEYYASTKSWSKMFLARN